MLEHPQNPTDLRNLFEPVLDCWTSRLQHCPTIHVNFVLHVFLKW